MTTPQKEETPENILDLRPQLTLKKEAEAAARVAVQTSPAGMADLTTGTIRLDKPTDTTTASAPVVEGVVVQQPDPEAGADDPRWQTWSLLPEALTDPEVRRHRAKVLANHAEFHALRVPLYVAKGAGVAARRVWDYEQVGEYGRLIEQARKMAKADPDNTDYPGHIAALREERAEIRRARHREPATILGASGCTSYVAALLALAEVWGVLAASPMLLPLFVTLAVLGYRDARGVPGTGQVVSGVVVDSAGQAGSEPTMLGADTLLAAFRSAKVITKEQEIRLAGPVRAVSEHAAEAVVILPNEITAPRVVEAAPLIAEKLNADKNWIDVTQDGGDPNRVRIWLSDRDPFEGKRESPMLANPALTDVRKGIPIGFNRRGDVVYLKLWHVMALLGGSSRMGKGMVLRNIMCGLAWDPRVNIRLVAGAKPGEHVNYAPVCATFFGRQPQRLELLLDAFLAEANRREQYLIRERRAKLGEKDLEKFPLEILVIDEGQQYTERKPVPDCVGKLEDAAGFCAALNMVILFITQDPSADTVPRKYRNNTQARLSTKTQSATQTNAILKDGASGNGLRAHELPHIPGLMILDIDGAPGSLVKSFFIEDEEFDGSKPVIDAAAEMRRQLGRGPGQFEDPIEAFLVEQTGLTSAGGGKDGLGYPSRPAAGGGDGGQEDVIDLMLKAFETAGRPDRLATADLLRALGGMAPATWSPQALGVPADDERAYVQKGGTELKRAIDAALAGTGRELLSRKWTKGGRANGYFLSEVEAAAGIAPE